MDDISRRAVGLGLAAVSAGFSLRARSAPATQAIQGLTHDAEVIHQDVLFAAAPHRVYAALMTTEQFDKVVRLGIAAKSLPLEKTPTHIEPVPGGIFTLFGGYITGRQLELVPDQRIVQAWSEPDWGPGLYSIARFELSSHQGGTRLLFSQTGFPAGAGADLAKGWYENYWDPLKKFLA